MSRTETLIESLKNLLAGEVPAILLRPGRPPQPAPQIRGRIIFPGSFNPLHEGHRQLLRTAEELTGKKGIPELSVENVDKPPLTAEETLRRLSSLTGEFEVLVTRAPRFADKTRLLPGNTFLLGFDTAHRLLDPAYCREDGGLNELLYRFREFECDFLIGGRLADGSFHTLDELTIPAEFKDLFRAIPENLFRYDISSTELRQLNARKQDEGYPEGTR